jgi:hypothetical protein
MKSLRKSKKSELISLIKKYEENVTILTDELEKMALNPGRVEYVYKNDDDDVMIKYIKGRLRCVRGLRRLPYIKEYERLMGREYIEV